MRRLLPACLALTALFASCGGGAESPTPTATTTPSPLPTRPRATPFPTFTPTPAVAANRAIVVGGDVRLRAEPSSGAAEVGLLQDHASVVIDRAVEGENWLVGGQTWVPAVPDWTDTWFRLVDGSYVYAAFVFILQPGEANPLIEAVGEEKWIDVDVAAQEARAMVGDTPVFAAPVSTGSAAFPSPPGTHRIGYRTPVERMTSAQAGYAPGEASYDVERVLFTQYYADGGNALHLNYWRPAEVFGSTATSHGCVGMQLHDAQWFWLFATEGTRVEVH